MNIDFEKYKWLLVVFNESISKVVVSGALAFESYEDVCAYTNENDFSLTNICKKINVKEKRNMSTEIIRYDDFDEQYSYLNLTLKNIVVN